MDSGKSGKISLTTTSFRKVPNLSHQLIQKASNGDLASKDIILRKAEALTAKQWDENDKDTGDNGKDDSGGCWAGLISTCLRKDN